MPEEEHRKLSNEYIAGFFDGEGCIIISKRKAWDGRKVAYGIQCCIVQATLEPLDYLQSKYGGVITDRKEHRNKQNSYCWILTCKRAEKFISDIRPYVYLKKDELDVAYQFCNTLIYVGKQLSDEVLKYREFLKLELSRCKNAKRIARTIKKES